MVSFGLITEGLTDQIVIEDILSGYFDSDDIIINPLQPERDKDDENKSVSGGWTLVFKYCQSSDFREAFQFNEYVIIQIDTDVSEETNYDILKRDENGEELTTAQLIEKVKEKFKGLIGEDFYVRYNEKIIFAITVHSIECWLLPLYYRDNRKEKITNCLSTLNQELVKREKFTIDVNKKNPEYYRKVSRQYCKQKVLMKLYQENPSLKIFIQEIEKRNIAIEDDNLE
ncbi:MULTISPECIES: phage tail protein [Aerosakkonema]|uniref:phage tail protein n=1 Tax=Aerosakkonema TaxID=1246629 RepID=UPI0035B96FF2